MMFLIPLTGISCDNSGASSSTPSDNGDGTWDVTFDITFAGSEPNDGDSHGFVIDIIGADVIDISDTSFTSSNGTTIDGCICDDPYVSDTQDVNFGDWANDNIDFVTSNDPQETFTITLTLNSAPDSFEVWGPEYSNKKGGSSCLYTGTYSESLPVTLLYFKGEAKKDELIFKWKTASETNNKGFYIQGSKAGKKWDNIIFIEGQNFSSLGFSYKKRVDIPEKDIKYFRLKQIDHNGEYDIYGPIFLKRKEKKKRIERVVDIRGREVTMDHKGIKIIIYKDGTTKKYK